MRLPVFFTCLCFLLLLANGATHASKFSAQVIQHESISKAYEPVSAIINTSIRKSESHSSTAFFATDIVENEDADKFLSKKYKASSYLPLTIPCQLFLNKCFGAVNSDGFYYPHLSDKYIFQRVLRLWSPIFINYYNCPDSGLAHLQIRKQPRIYQTGPRLMPYIFSKTIE